MPGEKTMRLANWAQTSGKSGPAFFREVFFVFGAEIFVGPGTAGETDDRALGGQVSRSGELKESGDKLAMGQVAGCAEEDDCAGLGNAGPG